jgi:hypothetical protein
VGLPEPRELEQWLDDVRERLRDGEDVDAVDQALAYLEADPYYFRSGYARAKLARSLAQASLSRTDRERARRYVLDAVVGGKHCSQRELSQLAGAVANNELRAVLRARLHASDHATARRALHTLRGVRSPGLRAPDFEAARELVLVDLRRTTGTPPSVARVSNWLWSPDWEADLREIARHHGPDRAGAKHLIEAADRRRQRRRPGH